MAFESERPTEENGWEDTPEFMDNDNAASAPLNIDSEPPTDVYQSGSGSLEELGANISNLYQISHQIARAKNENEIIIVAERILRQIPYVSILLTEHADNLQVSLVVDPLQPENPDVLLEWPPIPKDTLAAQMTGRILVSGTDTLGSFPATLLNLLRRLKLRNVAFIPTRHIPNIAVYLIIGTMLDEALPPEILPPFSTIAELIASSLDHVRQQKLIEGRLNELETIARTSQIITSTADITNLYTILHEQIRYRMGDVGFSVARYDSNTDSIHMPYQYEPNETGGEHAAVEPYPLGKDLTSTVIQTKQPLMILNNAKKQIAALGIVSTEKPTLSWLGVPLIASGEVIGALILRDFHHENAFTEGDLRFLSTFAAQVGGEIFNVYLLSQANRRSALLQTTTEIARDLTGSLDLTELIGKAARMIRERLQFYHVGIFMHDPLDEYVVIRDATGEAGTQMVRAGHKIIIGSDSIIGKAAESGEAKVINDTTRVDNYYINPLLPETRSEVAIPLRGGKRMLGVVNVQSAFPYAFSTEEINVLTILTDQLAIAIVNTELFAESQEHLSQHRLLHHVTTAAASGTTLDEALLGAAQGLQVTLGGDYVAIMLANKEAQQLETKAVAGFSDTVRGMTVPYGKGITGWVAAHQQPIRIDDVTKDPRYISVRPEARAELAVPLIYRGELLGVINVESDRVGAYTENDQEMLGTLGGSLAAIIANARLIEQTRMQAERERMLYEITGKIRRSPDIKAIMTTTAAEICRALGMHRAQVILGTEFESGEPPAGGEQK
ncbi:MAG: GAF domain-containing protein [Chloroflexota bacterium]